VADVVDVLDIVEPADDAVVEYDRTEEDTDVKVVC